MRSVRRAYEEPASAGIGLYVHLPFCPYLCPYCDFAKWPLRRSRAERYLKALEVEIDDAPAARAATVFVGGGTPNAYAPQQLGALLELLRKRFAVADGAEITVEMNPEPRLCGREVFEAYARAGVTRVSFGVQSFVDEELVVLGRRHRFGDVAGAVARARQGDITDISLDLMFGVPGQTLQSWRRTLALAIELDPPHLSTYGLTIEENTPFGAWRSRRPNDFMSEEAEAELYGIAIDTLEAAGYEHYEISNFARPGARCEHNANYWRNGEYLGLGVGAASYLDGVRSAHGRDLEAYCCACERGTPPPKETERLQGDARVGEAAMLALRTREGIDVAAFQRRYGVDLTRCYADAIAKCAAAGTLETTSSHVRLTRRGRFIANDVCAEFVA